MAFYSILEINRRLRDARASRKMAKLKFDSLICLLKASLASASSIFDFEYGGRR